MTDRKGFSLIEIIITIALMAILTGIALPQFIEWRKNYTYRQAANEIATALKGAKSRAVTTNTQHRLELNSALNQYQISRGSSAYRSSSWSSAGLPGGTLSDKVFLNLSNATLRNIEFNPNGTSTSGFVRINDSNAPITKYRIEAERSGKISMKRM